MKNPKLTEAVTLIKAGDKQAAQKVLVEIIKTDPKSKDAETAWYGLSTIVGSPDKKRQCYQAILKINPDNQKAISKLEKLSNSRTQEESKHRQQINIILEKYLLPLKIELLAMLTSQNIKANHIAIVLTIMIFGCLSLLSFSPKNQNQNQSQVQIQPTSTRYSLPATFTPYPVRQVYVNPTPHPITLSKTTSIVPNETTVPFNTSPRLSKGTSTVNDTYARPTRTPRPTYTPWPTYPVINYDATLTVMRATSDALYSGLGEGSGSSNDITCTGVIVCMDMTISNSSSRRGACSHHGGVLDWCR